MAIETIDEQSPHLETVKLLWRAHSDTLGFFPSGAFQDYAREKHIIVALADDGKCVGYLLYRVSRDKAVVVHFCVASSARNQGFARALITHLSNITKHLRGISLNCRRDFEANKTWPRLGFHPIGERQGRSANGSILVRWYLDHGHPQLFSDCDDPNSLKAAMDTNIFLDLIDGKDEESQGLTADWLQMHLSLAYTAELPIDINRNEDAAIRKQRSTELQQFAMLECTLEEYQRAESTIASILPKAQRDQDESDFRHVIRAAATDADVFVTRDASILKLADPVFEICGLSIVRPAELIGHIDVLQREKEYQRKYIAGTRQVIRERVHLSDGSLVTSIALHGERQRDLTSALNKYLSDPQHCECHKVTGDDGLLAFYVIEHDRQMDRVPILRICARRQAGTIARAVLTSLVRQAASNGTRSVLVSEVSDIIRDACASLGFLNVQEGWLKLILTGWIASDEVSSKIDFADARIGELLTSLPSVRDDVISASLIEHILSPAKLSDSALLSYIVPIRPQFAEHLFDERLAAGGLFGADVDLALNPESAYYRAARPSVIRCPSRVLWYVSDSKKHAGSKSIRACSRLVELVTDIPKPLFRRYRRYGVYDWEDVVSTAKGNLDQEIMAFRFDDSELLPPIPWNTFQEILRANGIKTTLQSPVAIPSKVFGEIYSLAFHSSRIC